MEFAQNTPQTIKVGAENVVTKSEKREQETKDTYKIT